ncbi:protein-L-isoaspartate(D-aspartate) O-methyltransferase [Tistlia consotensis]|uniref:Protein-L-isoaspartate O-methyltransferase n=1 Tax=Tistlia consotensis USBA 355 TaxID=560819 RepID=A0A1Y6BJN4_9PROT|nr:protein-L-isoaspartate O-methyltransferase [Tistlia consotensis]SMF14663.1 protein-L-isoaspartate(D-aspartate) O-methyltransferase [Tistlia consotensis USBA 355]SNR49348.1 protein-L-isoaspartate(D-aspartate) O-methyltransferase [Tistlia consotensis]
MDYATARLNMVESQLRTNRVFDAALLDAFEALPRERFVPEARRGFAYVDEDLPLGGGRYLMEPMVLGRLIQAAGIEPADSVLDVAGATGYGTALLARLAASVVLLEPDGALAQQAETTLDQLQVDNAVVVTGDPAQGYARQAPYEAIVVEAAVAELPAALLDQLAEGGRLVAPLLERPGLCRAVLARKDGGAVSQRVLFDCSTPVLPGFERQEGFVF